MAITFAAELHCDHEGCHVSAPASVVLYGNLRLVTMEVSVYTEHSWTQLDGLHFCSAHPPQATCLGNDGTYPCGLPIPSLMPTKERT